MDLRRIVVGLDVGSMADGAIRRAYGLAERTGARLDLVHAVRTEPPARGIGSAERWAGLHADVLVCARELRLAHIDLLLEGVETTLPPPEERLVVEPGPPARVLQAHVRAHVADLLVLGAHRRSKVIDVGGTMRGVLADAPCPVWIEKASPSPIDRIRVGLDMSEHDPATLATAHALARSLGASVEAIHAFDVSRYTGELGLGPYAIGPHIDPEEIRAGEQRDFERELDAIDWGDVDVSASFVEGRPVDALLAEQDGARLIVLGTHGRSAVARFLLGSVAHEVAQRALSPVVVVPSPERKYLED